MRILFVPDYAEPLYAVLPLVRASRKRGHEVDILCWLRVKGDKKEIPQILAEYGETAQFMETPDSPFSGFPSNTLSNHFGFAKIMNLIKPTFHQNRMRDLAIQKLAEFSPDILVVTNEHLPLLAYFIDVAIQRGIPSVCYLNFSGAFSARKLREQYDRVRNPETWIGPHRRLDMGPLSQPRGLIERFFMCIIAGGLCSYRFWHRLDITFPTPYYGGGNATYLTAIGKGSRDTFVELGVDPKKIRIVGFPIYEELYHKAERNGIEGNTALRRQLGLPLDKPLFLWGTNDQRSYYEGQYSYEKMLDSWKAIRDVILKVNPDWHLVIKLHPKESIEDYLPVVHYQPRVTLIKDCNIWELIAESSFFLTRFSSTATSAICLGKPTVTHNIPEVPGGVLFEDIGGTFHANTLEDLEKFVSGLAYNPEMQAEAARRREEFIEYQIDINERPAADRFVDLVEDIV